MSTENRDERDGLDARNDEALWALLGRREPPRQVSPYFARRVLREVGLAEEARAKDWRTRLQRWLPPAPFGRRAALWSGALSGVCALGLVCLVQLTQVHPRASRPVRSTTTSVVAPAAPEAGVAGPGTEGDGPAVDDDSVPVEENEVIADLDNILQREESRLWTDDTSPTARF